MKNNVKRYPVYTVFANNMSDPFGGISERPLHVYHTREEAEESIESGWHDKWMLTGDADRLYVSKTWTKEDAIPKKILEQIKFHQGEQ